MARSAPEQAGQSPDAMTNIGCGGKLLSISRREGNCTAATDIDGKPPQPTMILSPEAQRRARGCKPRFARPTGRAAPDRAHERRDPTGALHPKGGMSGAGAPAVERDTHPAGRTAEILINTCERSGATKPRGARALSPRMASCVAIADKQWGHGIYAVPNRFEWSAGAGGGAWGVCK